MLLTMTKLLLLLLCVPLVAWILECPSQWSHFNGSCYQYQNRQITFSEAQVKCERGGAHLVEIDCPTENDFVFNLLIKENNFRTPAWIGLNDMVAEGIYVWNSYNRREACYTKWERGEPDNRDSGEDCVEMLYTTGYWNDTDCHYTLPYICEFS